MKFIKFGAVMLLAATGTVSAQVTSYVPLHESPQLERDIDLLLLKAQLPVNKRPVAKRLVQQAYDSECKNYQNPLCLRIDKYLKQDNGLQQASVSLNHSEQQALTNKNQRSLNSKSSFNLKASGYFGLNEWIGVSAGMYADEDGVTPENSYVSMGTDWAQLDIGFRPHWFSPFSQSAMLVSTNAESFPSITVSNSTPLSDWLFSYEIFIGQLSESNRIRYQGELTTGRPLLTGMHFEISPFKGFSLSLNRIMQSGGRGSQTLEDLLNAFIDPSGSDNNTDSLTVDEEFGNQAASLTTRFDFAGETPFSLYLEYAGEDTSRGTNWRLGNTSLSFGVFVPQIWNNLDLRYETSHWQNAWYVHHVYKDGLTYEGNILGHWAAEQRLKDNSKAGHGIGAFHQNLILSWQVSDTDRLEADLSTTENEDYSTVSYDDAYSLKLVWWTSYKQLPFALSLSHNKDVFGESFSSISTQVAW